MTNKPRTNLFSVFTLILISSSSLAAEQPNNPTNKVLGSNQTFAITHVNVISMEKDKETINNATVVIQDKKILNINGEIPANAEIIDGKNKWLIPGLIDMHVHTNASINFKGNQPTQGATFFMDTQYVMTTYVANGVTTVFELDGRVAHFAQRNEIASGQVIGPRMALAPVINGGDQSNGGRIVNTASDARQAVRSLKAEGYNFVKVYSHLNVESFEAVIDEASKQGLKVVGHIPDAFKGKTAQAFVPHFGLVAHAEEYSKQIRNRNMTAQDAEYFAEITKNNGTWVTPNLLALVSIANQARSLDSIRTMDTLKYVHPILQDKWLTSNQYHKNASPENIAYFERLIDFHKALVKAFKKAGVPMLVGTDAGTSGILTGFSLHDELALLVEAGMTNEETLMAATRLPAEWLGIEDTVGTVSVGKYADLILLNANPLDDISNTRAIDGVFVNGTWLDKDQIDAMLLKLAKWNESMKDHYKWSNRKNYN
ncbi:amidohydrolase family protein [Marinicella litoralis]|uniref:Imidazolonepropionase-like amidohydrolase n=1 Tax=Marinicella litoralis TaxID=644220 RepID=A0A4R6XAY6_9GAMM|nr:amidohydrolase family protein [Marinicella litoralis]TDR16375.1 imidazolonepropionase-like amidohydrolase [Marinicella litoralis]